MFKYLERLTDMKMIIPLKLYHKINSLGGCRAPTHNLPHPLMILGQFGDNLGTVLGQFLDNS
jgi:hypothetical protein